MRAALVGTGFTGVAGGFLDTFKQLYRAVHRAGSAGRPPAEPDYPAVAGGHGEILTGGAIARSARKGGWSDVAR